MGGDLFGVLRAAVVYCRDEKPHVAVCWWKTGSQWFEATAPEGDARPDCER